MKLKETYGKTRRRTFAVLLTLAVAVSGLCGQEYDRRWALSYAGDALDKPVLTHRPPGVSTGRGSSALRLTGEYYLRDRWSLTAGYFRTDVSYGHGHRLMEGAHAGTRRYFLRPDFIIQPYLSAATELNWGEHTQRRDGLPDYTQHTVNPRLSFIPGAGVELYLFTSVAFTVEYGFHMGLASRTEIVRSPDGPSPQVMRDRGMFHSLSLGAKITFPFTFTSDDGNNLLELIWEMIFHDLHNK
jgi:hypothetical protein